MDGCRQANKNVHNTVVLGEMFDVKTWMSPVMEGVHNHSNPHIFKFVRDSRGRCRMYYKHWNHDPWEPPSGEGLILLKVTFSILLHNTHVAMHLH